MDALSRETVAWIYSDVRLRRPKRDDETFQRYAIDLISQFNEECIYIGQSKPKIVHAYICYRLARRIIQTIECTFDLDPVVFGAFRKPIYHAVPHMLRLLGMIDDHESDTFDSIYGVSDIPSRPVHHSTGQQNSSRASSSRTPSSKSHHPKQAMTWCGLKLNHAQSKLLNTSP